MFQRNVLPPSSGSNTEGIYSSKKLVTTHKIRQHHNPDVSEVLPHPLD
jgi:hypothetical protein